MKHLMNAASIIEAYKARLEILEAFQAGQTILFRTRSDKRGKMNIRDHDNWLWDFDNCHYKIEGERVCANCVHWRCYSLASSPMRSTGECHALANSRQLPIAMTAKPACAGDKDASQCPLFMRSE